MLLGPATWVAATAVFAWRLWTLSQGKGVVLGVGSETLLLKHPALEPRRVPASCRLASLQVQRGGSEPSPLLPAFSPSHPLSPLTYILAVDQSAGGCCLMVALATGDSNIPVMAPMSGQD